jgi:hypothetical protein
MDRYIIFPARRRQNGFLRFAGLAALLAVFLAACGMPPAQPQVEVLRPLPVEAVTVQVGVGSPIPVDVVASGTWNGLCAQLARVEHNQDGKRIEISLSASAEKPGCPVDNLGVPFRVAVPLNVVQMEIGEYQVAVNGVETTFEWDPQKIVSSRPRSQTAIVRHVGVEIGVDSPSSVNVVVSGEFPNTCAQIDTIDQTRSPGYIQMTILAEIPPGPAPDGSECREGGLPFRLPIPLNSDNLEPGNYTIDVNGQQANFDWPPSPG